MKIQTLCASLLMSGTMMAQSAVVKPIVMKTPNEFYILAASPNGKWACGAYVDDSNSTYAFRWNLESGEVEMLDAANESTAYSVSNDGLVVGTFTDYTYHTNGAATTLAGYWKDNKWNRLEMPDDGVSSSGAAAVTPDGHYMAGNVYENGVYSGYIWKDGKIYKELVGTRVAMPYGISPDGQGAVGWVMRDNRTACWWHDDDITLLSPDYQTPSCAALKFTPDATRILFWGGWNNFGTDEKPDYALSAIYDIATGGVSPLYPINENANLELVDISNKGTVVGANDIGYVYQDGKAYYADDYLTERGVDLAAEHVVMMPETDYYLVSRAVTVSADDNVMGFQYYNDDKDETGEYSVSAQSMVVKFNQPTTGLCPVSVKARQLSGIGSVLVSWKPNVSAQGISGYNVYRDGQKLNSALISGNSFVDANVGIGNHKYVATAVYGSDESARSEEASIDVADRTVAQPIKLLAQQRGYNSAYMEWDKPQTNFSSLTYYDRANANLESFGVSEDNAKYEIAIRIDSTQASAYRGQQVQKVSFYPMSEQNSWTVKLYTHDANGKLQLLYSQPVSQQLNYGKQNTIELTEPVDVPSGDLLVAIAVEAPEASDAINGMGTNTATKGYSDLVKMADEDDFYSIGELMQENGYMYPATWAVEAVVMPKNSDANADMVDAYEVYVDGKQVGNTKSTDYEAHNLAAGNHTMAVKAVYANGVKSETSDATLTIATDDSHLKGVDNVGIDHTSNSTIKAFWNTPKDYDKVTLQYCGNEPSTNSIVGPQDNNYAIQAGSIYTKNMLRGRTGYNITSARFYPLNDATFTIYIYENDNLVSETEVDNYTTGKWNEVKLSEPVTIKDNSKYMLVVDCYDVLPQAAPLAVDNNAPVSGYSDIYSLDGDSWNPLSTAAVYANWMIGLNIENPNPLPLPVAGYDITIDGKKQNTDMLTQSYFDYDFTAEDAKQHTVQVDVYYTIQPQKSVKGNVNTFYIGTAGIEDNTIGVISLVQGDNQITVQGNNVSSVALVAANGATVAQVAGNTVSLNGVSAGVYMVKAVVDGEMVVRKVQVK